MDNLTVCAVRRIGGNNSLGPSFLRNMIVVAVKLPALDG